ncbi:hypothetical protein EKO23_00945 [Nocardioides guangzhouensis]|uniref:Exo-alpha-sialidase n=1 Tax=Nocardioides guangzhouensis TaxID=2497878 RepID=A0A4Q4ZKT1_9ACTN|nr:hypothetical protein [Nocardioides guangzhouensis]RYP89027.1 hypothetical protein EKO23_00945 [Nocardioides guangzhouensis]
MPLRLLTVNAAAAFVTCTALLPGCLDITPATGITASRSLRVTAADPIWATPELVVPADLRPEEAQVFAEPSGRTTVTWFPDGGTGLYASTKDPDTGVWNDPLALDPNASASLESDPSPTLLLAESGELTVGYWRWRDPMYLPDLWTVTRSPDGIWDTPVRVNPPGSHTYDFGLTIDGAGNITAAWVQRRVGAGEPLRLVIAHRPAGGTWSQPRFLTGTGTRVRSVALDAAPTGEVTVAWTGIFTRPGHPRLQALRARTHIPGTGWSEVERITAPTEEANRADVAAVPGGRASIAWDYAGYGPVTVASRSSAGRWTKPTVMTKGRHIDSYDLAAAAGLRTLTWTAPAGSLLPWPEHRRYIGIRVRGSSGWSPATRLSPRNRQAAWPGAHITSDRRVVVHWQETPSYNFEHWDPTLRTRGTDGTWSEATTLAPMGAGTRRFAGTYLDTNDLMHVAWKGSDGAVWVAEQRPD